MQNSKVHSHCTFCPFFGAEYATEGLRYMIECEKAYNRKKKHGNLGVRVQTSGIHSDITADTAMDKYFIGTKWLLLPIKYFLRKKDIEYSKEFIIIRKSFRFTDFI